MLSVIKTAIITIIISFISGVLLDTYKNYAPRILCIIGKAVQIVQEVQIKNLQIHLKLNRIRVTAARQKEKKHHPSSDSFRKSIR